MTDRSSLAAAVHAELAQLAAALDAPQALVPPPEARLRLASSLERVRAQLQDAAEPVLIVALAGGTGAGKSTLINALAGSVIAESGPRRPTTTGLRVYHYHGVEHGGLPASVSSEATFVAHDRPELRLKVLVDTPDLDSFRTEHRDTTRALLKAAGLVLYVFSPDNYSDERTWSVLRDEKRFSACAAVLNKIDRTTPEELATIAEDLRGRFAGAGLPDVRIFRTSAAAHLAAVPAAAPVSDDLAALRGYLERELAASDVARLVRRQRQRVLDELAAEVERIAPRELLARLEPIEQLGAEGTARAAERIAEALAPRLAAIEQELVPLVVLRQHERFRGPFRTWLSVADFFRFGLSGLVRRWMGRPAQGAEAIRLVLATAAESVPADALAAEALALQDALYQHELPVRRWHQLAAEIDGAQLVGQIASELHGRFEEEATARARSGRVLVTLVSGVGALAPAVFVAGGLFVLTRDLFAQSYVGLPLLVHVGVMIVLLFMALQGVASLLLPSERWLSRGLARQCVQAVVARWLRGALAAYRHALEADVEALQRPLDALRGLLAAAAALPAASAPARLPPAGRPELADPAPPPPAASAPPGSADPATPTPAQPQAAPRKPPAAKPPAKPAVAEPEPVDLKKLLTS